MSGEWIRFTIDGKEVAAPAGELLVEAAARAGIEIPVFCYHPKLDPVGVCRMCLVEVEGIPKPVPACTTPVRDGMVVQTASERVETIQRGVLEFLLLNHPLDCPVCDKGGECPLQDNTFRYGPTVTRLADGKMRKRKAVDLGQFIVLDEERCILCRRCARFDDEVAREGNLIVGQRGHEAIITTSTGGSYDSYFSGNTIELCPVGALTSDLYRFKGRPWDLSSAPAVCTGCSVGCNVRLDFRFGKLLRVVSRDNPGIDGGWLCDRGRFNYTYVQGEERLTQPLIRRNGGLEPATWAEALQFIGQRLGRIRSEAGGEAIGLLGGGRLTNEAAYLLQKLGRAVLQTPHVDYRAGGQAVAAGAGYPGRITDLDDADTILVVDLLPQERAPVLDLRIRRALHRRNVKAVSIGAALPWYKDGGRAVPVVPEKLGEALQALANAVGAEDGGVAAVEGVPAADLEAAAQDLRASKKLVVLWSGTGAGVGHALLGLLDQLGAGGREVSLLVPGEQANSRGAEFMGMRPGWLPGYRRADDPGARELFEKAWQVELPQAEGWNTGQMFQAAVDGRLQALFIAGANPVLTYPDGELARKALEAVPLLVVADLFLTDTAALADVVLPAAPFPAVEGTYTNLDGHVQAVEAAMHAGGESRADVDILRAVAEAVGGGHVLAPSAQEFAWELQHLVGGRLEEGRVPTAPRELLSDDPVAQGDPAGAGAQGGDGLRLVPVERLFAGGGTSYHDPGIQRARPQAVARIHPADAGRLGLQAGDPVGLAAGGTSLTLAVAIAEDVQPGTVQVPAGLPEAPVNRLAGGGHPVVKVSKLVLGEVG